VESFVLQRKFYAIELAKNSSKEGKKSSKKTLGKFLPSFKNLFWIYFLALEDQPSKRLGKYEIKISEWFTLSKEKVYFLL